MIVFGLFQAVSTGITFASLIARMGSLKVAVAGLTQASSAAAVGAVGAASAGAASGRVGGSLVARVGTRAGLAALANAGLAGGIAIAAYALLIYTLNARRASEATRQIQIIDPIRSIIDTPAIQDDFQYASDAD